jgi:hypothetical protein
LSSRLRSLREFCPLLPPLSLTALGLQGSREVGVVATAINAVVDSSVTNFVVSQD